jgi:hypothetical protein
VLRGRESNAHSPQFLPSLCHILAIKKHGHKKVTNNMATKNAATKFYFSLLHRVLVLEGLGRSSDVRVASTAQRGGNNEDPV